MKSKKKTMPMMAAKGKMPPMLAGVKGERMATPKMGKKKKKGM